jgi:glycosyltransferase involved in cell wall biosynthesis
VHLVLVGSFGYFPNEDAALFFGQEIWPRFVRAADRPARLSIVGSRPSPAVRRLGEKPGITVTGEVPSVTPYYDRAQAAINPIRAGGGTRIKAIEAFAHRVPLVSTTIGAEGLDAAPGRHLLVADGAEDFARACLRLVREPDLRERLATAAHDLYRERYASEPVIERICEIYRALGGR